MPMEAGRFVGGQTDVVGVVRDGQAEGGDGPERGDKAGQDHTRVCQVQSHL